MKKILTLITFLLMAGSLSLLAQNPYLPMWEYIPDGEPYVFEDPDCPGRYRVYVYGSHDNLITEYCGKDQVVWSAPVEDLSAWRYDGIIFVSKKDAQGNDLHPDGSGDVLYAPDVAVRKEKDGKTRYYLYPNNQNGGRQNMMAVSERPDGPFEVFNWSKDNPACTEGVLGFDPAVFVDDDGRVYGYWGFQKSFGAELDPVTMATVKPGTEIVEDMVSNCRQEGVFRFFEASSIRKIEDKYVFVYSRVTSDGEFGLYPSNNTLAYAYGDSPLGPFKYGGTLIDARGRDTDEDGKVIPTASAHGNTHGSILLINGQWWVFYHRQTGTNQFSRQAMVAPIEVSVQKGKGGKVEITEGECTSEGFRTQGLDPLCKTPAGWVSYYTNPKGIGEKFPDFHFTGSYIKSTRSNPDSYEGPFNQKMPYCPVINNTARSVVGYKYFKFDDIAGAGKVFLKLHLIPQGTDGRITVMVGGPSVSKGGRKIAGIILDGSAQKSLTEVTVPCTGYKGLTGKQPLFFRFESEKEDVSLCELYDFQFVVE